MRSNLGKVLLIGVFPVLFYAANLWTCVTMLPPHGWAAQLCHNNPSVCSPKPAECPWIVVSLLVYALIAVLALRPWGGRWFTTLVVLAQLGMVVFVLHVLSSFAP